MKAKPGPALSPEARKVAVASIRRFFTEELDQDVGDLRATLVLDYFLAELAPSVYNGAISDAQAYFSERTAELDALCHNAEFAYWPAESRRKPAT